MFRFGMDVGLLPGIGLSAVHWLLQMGKMTLSLFMCQNLVHIYNIW